MDSFLVLVEACQTYLQIKTENVVGLSEVNAEKYPDTTLVIQEQIQRKFKK